MEIRSRNSDGNIDPIWGTIITANTKDKILEFRNAMTLAYLEDYANIQGRGGQKHAPRSGIRMIIQDNSGKVTVKTLDAIIPTYVLAQILEVCRDNLYAPQDEKAPQKGSKITGMDSVPVNILTLTSAFSAFISKCMRASANIVLKKGNAAGPFADFGAVFKETAALFSTPVQDLNTTHPYTEYAYHQDRLNTYKKDKEGFCPYTSCDIKREQYRDNNGSKELSKSPWMIMITTQDVIAVVDQEKGTSYPKMSTSKNKCSLTINISDSEMYKCMHHVEHFVQLWEIAYGVPLIKNGITQAETQFQAVKIK